MDNFLLSYKNGIDEQTLAAHKYIGFLEWINKYVVEQYRNQLLDEVKQTTLLFYGKQIDECIAMEMCHKIYSILKFYELNYDVFYYNFKRNQMPTIKLFEIEYGRVILVAKEEI